MRAMRGSGKLLCFGSWLVACGAGNAQGGESLTSHDRSDGALVWQTCPKLPPFPDEPTGECSKNRVPLFWDEPAVGELEIVVRRFQPKGPRRGTLWMLAGGPGGTGASSARPDNERSGRAVRCSSTTRRKTATDSPPPVIGLPPGPVPVMRHGVKWMARSPAWITSCPRNVKRAPAAINPANIASSADLPETGAPGSAMTTAPAS